MSYYVQCQFDAAPILPYILLMFARETDRLWHNLILMLSSNSR